MSQPPPLFSAARHRAQRDRLARLPADANFLAPILAETLLDRLEMVTRDFDRILLIGAHDAALADALRARYITPLLQARADSLDEERAAKRKDIIDTEREEARAAQAGAH